MSALRRHESMRAPGRMHGVLWSLVVAFVLAAAADAQPRDDARWVISWATAQTLLPEVVPPWIRPPPPEAEPESAPPSPIPPFPQALDDQTVRMTLRASVGGSRLRLQLSNAAGVEPARIGAIRVALRDAGATIVAGSDRAVTFGGRRSFAIPPGALLVSDPVDLEVPALAELAVSLYLPERTETATTHALGLNTSYIVDGDATARPSLPDAQTNLTYFWLTGVEVFAPAGTAAIVAFGDSITDGFSTTPNTHRAWPAQLAARLASDPATAHLGIVNMGISGNRIRLDGAGSSGLARFDRDVLARAGVEWLVVLAGINDINFNALPGVPDSEQATAEQIIEALSQLVDRAHAEGLKVMGATLMPTAGLWLHNERTEAMRSAVNDWVRTGGKFDALVDFDAVTREPSRPSALRAEFDSGDHIHPNDAGTTAMADAIDTRLFVR